MYHILVMLKRFEIEGVVYAPGMAYFGSWIITAKSTSQAIFMALRKLEGSVTAMQYGASYDLQILSEKEISV